MRNVLMIFLLLCACKRAQDYSVNDFKLVNPKQYWLNLNSIKPPIKCLEVINYELIAIDNSNNLFSYNVNTKLTDKIGLEKSNPTDFISLTEIFALSPSKFVVYDLTSDSFFEYLHNANKWSIGNTFQLDLPLHGMPSISSLSNNQFVATSLNNVQGKLFIGNVSPKPKILKYIGKINKRESENKYITGMINRSACVYDKWTNSIFVANFYSDNIECYSLNGKLRFNIKGTDNFEPTYKVKNVQGGQVFVNTPKTRNAFIPISSDKKYIYALYSGQTLGQQESKIKKTIFIFSKGGTPLKKIQLTADIGLIKADELSHSLFCYYIDENPKNQILVYATDNI